MLVANFLVFFQVRAPFVLRVLVGHVVVFLILFDFVIHLLYLYKYIIKKYILFIHAPTLIIAIVIIIKVFFLPCSGS